MSDFYVTTYCNKPHRLKDGMPIDHECRVIPPEALQLEMKGEYTEAIAVMSGKPTKYSRGVKQ